jgi:hypothetical protein
LAPAQAASASVVTLGSSESDRSVPKVLALIARRRSYRAIIGQQSVIYQGRIAVDRLCLRNS